MPDKALVLGGAGFIGSHLLERLRDSGRYAELVCADIRPPRVALQGVSYRSADVREPLPPDLCPGATEIYNLAAVHTTPGHEDWEYFWTNVLGAINACDYAAATGASLIVFTSSIAVYGPAETPKDESAPPAPASAYGRSKLQAEMIHAAWRRADDRRRLIVIRPAVVYGPGEGGNFTRLAGLLRRRRFVYPGRRDTVKACGYVGELIRSIEFARGQTETDLLFNFCHPQPTPLEEICRAFHEVAGYPEPGLTLPLPAMMLAARGFEALDAVGLRSPINRARILKLVDSTNIVPRRLAELGYGFETDLRGSLRLWQEASPEGEFV